MLNKIFNLLFLLVINDNKQTSKELKLELFFSSCVDFEIWPELM
jgi:hypothetical protein